MAEPILTKFGVKHPWVKGVQICSYKGAGSPGGPTMGKKVGNFQILKNHPLVNYKSQSCNISPEASLGHEHSSCSNHDPGVINGATPGDQSLTYYMNIYM